MKQLSLIAGLTALMLASGTVHARIERPEKAEKPEKVEKAEKAEKAEKPEKPEKVGLVTAALLRA